MCSKPELNFNCICIASVIGLSFGTFSTTVLEEKNISKEDTEEAGDQQTSVQGVTRVNRADWLRQATKANRADWHTKSDFRAGGDSATGRAEFTSERKEQNPPKS